MLRILLAAALLCAAAIPARADLMAMIDHAAASAGVPADIARAVIGKESNFNPSLRGAAGEWGLGQIKCQTAREVGLRGSCAQLAQPETNLRYSMAYLRLALDRGGEACAGVSLYQRGLYGRRGCSAYGRDVLRRARR
jgi:soluble lytic murein transglycosylase-like protein